MNFFSLNARFYIVFTLVTLVPAIWLASLLQNLIQDLTEPIKYIVGLGIIETPTAVAIIGFFFWIYKSFLWRIWPLKYIHRIPYIAGRYEGQTESSFNDGNKSAVILEIHQTLLNISVHLYSKQSSSFSVLASLGKNEYGNPCVTYIYKNKTRTVSHDLDMRSHDGFACLEIFEKGNELRGFYYNDPRERGNHGKLLCKLVSRKLLGHL